MTRGSARLAAGGLVLLLWAGAGEASSRVTFQTADGVTVAATLYEPQRRPAPGVVLVHMQGRTRRDWDPVASLLAARGVVALAIDLRNHGESSTGPGSSEDSLPFVNDVRAALDYLANRPDLVAGPRGLVGASVGANLAAVAAANAPGVSALVLLSPGLEYRNVRIEQPLRKYGDRAALIVVSQEDPYAVRSAHVLATAGTGLRDVRYLESAGHGTVMLSRSPDLADTLVDWLVARLL